MPYNIAQDSNILSRRHVLVLNILIFLVVSALSVLATHFALYSLQPESLETVAMIHTIWSTICLPVVTTTSFLHIKLYRHYSSVHISSSRSHNLKHGNHFLSWRHIARIIFYAIWLNEPFLVTGHNYYNYAK